MLLVAALRPPSPTFGAGAPRVLATVSPTPLATSTPTPSPKLPIPPSTRVLAALDNGTAWRASTGACPETAASPEYSRDGGVSWVATDATGTAEVSAVQNLRVLDGTTVELVALDEVDCTPQLLKTFVGGADYARYPVQLAATWYVDPADRSTVHAPVGNVVAPCASIVSLAAATADVNSAAILCSDQTVFRTGDSGLTWSQSVSVAGAVNLGVTTMGYVIATVGLPECAGVQLIALSDEAPSPTPTGCLQVTTPSETLPGNVAVSEADGTFWVWVGDEVKRSLDEGATWE